MNGPIDLEQLAVDAQRELAEGSPARACGLFETLIDRWTAIQGPDGERVLVWRGFLGRALTEARRYTEAEEVLGRLLIDRERVEGADAESTLVTRGNLIRAIGLGGRPREAMVQAQRLIEDRIRVLGEEHPSTMHARGHLARLHYNVAEYDIAAELYRDLVADRTDVLGRDHEDTRAARFNLAVSLAKSSMGGDDMVEGVADESLELLNRHGVDHPATATAFAVLAETLERHGRFDDALATWNVVIDCRARLLGDTDNAVIAARSARADCLVALGRSGDAFDEYVHVIDRYEVGGVGSELPALGARMALLSLLRDSGVLDEHSDHHDADLCSLAASTVATTRLALGMLEPSSWIRDDVEAIEDLLAVAPWVEPDPVPGNLHVGRVAWPQILDRPGVARFVTQLRLGAGPERVRQWWLDSGGCPSRVDDVRLSEMGRGDDGWLMVITLPTSGATGETSHVAIMVSIGAIGSHEQRPHAANSSADGGGSSATFLRASDGPIDDERIRWFSLEHRPMGCQFVDHLHGGRGVTWIPRSPSLTVLIESIDDCMVSNNGGGRW